MPERRRKLRTYTRLRRPVADAEREDAPDGFPDGTDRRRSALRRPAADSQVQRRGEDEFAGSRESDGDEDGVDEDDYQSYPPRRRLDEVFEPTELDRVGENECDRRRTESTVVTGSSEVVSVQVG